MSQQGTLGALKTALKKRMKLINQGYGRYNCHEVELYRVLQLIEELKRPERYRIAHLPAWVPFLQAGTMMITDTRTISGGDDNDGN